MAAPTPPRQPQGGRGAERTGPSNVPRSTIPMLRERRRSSGAAANATPAAESDARKASAGSSDQGNRSIRSTRSSERLKSALSAVQAADAALERAIDVGRAWQAVADGIPVLECPNGRVISVAGYETVAIQVGEPVGDAFGVDWAPMKLTDGSIGFSPVVLRRYSTDGEDVVECWKRVTASRAAPEPQRKPAERRRDSVRSQPILPLSLTVPIATIPSQGFLHSFQMKKNEDGSASPSHSQLFVPRQGAVGEVKWNSEWQLLMESGVNMDDPNEVEGWLDRVRTFYETFTTAARKQAVMLIEEIIAIKLGELKAQDRTIPPIGGVAGEHVFINGGILLEMVTETVGGGKVYKSLNSARRAAGLAMNHAGLLHNARGPMVAAPLCCCVTYLGMRVLCTALLPINPSTLAMGSVDGGKNFAKATRGGQLPSVYEKVLVSLAQELNLCPHKAGDEMHPVILAADTQIHAAEDGRVYITNLSRLMPPVLPLCSKAGNIEPSLLLTRQCRSEGVYNSPVAVSPDSFTSLVAPEDRLEDSLRAAICTQSIRTRCCQDVVDVFTSLECPAGLSKAGKECTMCTAPTDGQFRFTVCLRSCCVICKTCYMRMWDKAATEDSLEVVDGQLAGAAKCGGQARRLNGLPMEPSVTEIFHVHGVNLRYLGVVYSGLNSDMRLITQHYFQAEMIARACKGILFNKQTQATETIEGLNRIAIQTLRCLLLPSGRSVDTFWGEELGPALTAKYRLHMPFSTERIDRLLVFERMCTLCGLRVPDQAKVSLLLESRVVLDSLQQVPVVKGFTKFTPLPKGLMDEVVTENSKELAAFWKSHLGTRRYPDMSPLVNSLLDSPAS